MKSPAPQTIYLKDYTPPTHWIDQVHLFFSIQDDFTEVTATTQFRPNPENSSSFLNLDGDFFQLHSVTLNGDRLTADDYVIKNSQLTLEVPQEAFELKVVTRIVPEKKHGSRRPLSFWRHSLHSK